MNVASRPPPSHGGGLTALFDLRNVGRNRSYPLLIVYGGKELVQPRVAVAKLLADRDLLLKVNNSVGLWFDNGVAPGVEEPVGFS